MNEIEQLIYEGKADEAIRLLNLYSAKYPADDTAWYLRGNAYRKKANFRQALNNYLKAIELNPRSPAVQAYAMLMRILDYRNNDGYNP
ncbi:MAG: tetratricopeptide repeat protein [Tannerellaceae bacterium]|jgi:Flp pilus assembly protein TadD|nr:tetratricopeptide repeat protein [Tannerellaceae bacterium]